MEACQSVLFVAVLAVGCGGRTTGSEGGASGSVAGTGSVSAGVSVGAATGLLIGSSGLPSSGVNGSGGSGAVSVAGASSGAAACVAAGGQCVAGVGFCANVGPGATPASCLDVSIDMLCCSVNEDAGCTEIEASSYDQSCKTDSECVTVSVGNACDECVFACVQSVGAINAGAMLEYNADVAKTPAGVALSVGQCNCPLERVLAPCCRGGQCHVDLECSNGLMATDAGPIGGDAGASPASPPSCAPGGPGMTNCGPGGSGTESCCTSLEVTGRTFDRTYDPHLLNDGGTTVGVAVAADGGPIGEAAPATVSSFRLDKYLVTVGRFRQFINALTPPDGGIGWLPSPGSGKHTHLNGGAGLVDTGPTGGYEPGWIASDDNYVAPSTITLTSDAPYSTWTASASSQENLPINSVNWYEAYAFCIWDGGFLPSQAELEYAAAGGGQQREYPWGSLPPDYTNQYAIYGCYYPSSSGTCSGTVNIAPVGYPIQGAGLWGQLDLAGDVYEWELDWVAPLGGIPGNPYFVEPCVDCADVTSGGTRSFLGGAFEDDAWYLAPSNSFSSSPLESNRLTGIRCARIP
jgi:formylglycine-generating enzyme required for sulfatase activity